MQANAIWLLNWRDIGLENARRTGGACVQVLVPPGPSSMQIAEESMARDRGVRVLKIDCSHVKSVLMDDEAASRPEVEQLRADAERVKAGETLPVPPTRVDLEARLAAALARTAL